MINYAPEWQSEFLWTVIVGFIVAFFVAFGMGANDCANSYGTVVGSGVLKLWQAYILATVFEALGAVLLGYKVTETMRKSIVRVDIYDVYSEFDLNASLSSPSDVYTLVTPDQCNVTQTNCTRYTGADFMMGELGALTGTAFWLLVATIFHFPVSTTHSAVGATVGFSLVLRGSNGISWMTIVNIVISWIISPLLAGVVSVAFYLFIKFTCLKRDDPFESSLKMLPFFYWFALTVNLFSVLYGGSKYLKFDRLPWWACLLISFSIGTTVALIMWLWGNGSVRRRVQRKYPNSSGDSPRKIIVNDMNLNGTPRSNENVEIEIDGVSKTSKEGGSPHANGGTDSGVVVTPFHNSSELATMPSATPVANGVSTIALTNTETKPAMVDAKSLKAKSAIQNLSGVDRQQLCYNVQKVLKALKNPVLEHPYAMDVFNYLQIMSACFLSFSHGSNDTANAVGALVGLWLTFKDGDASKDTSNDPMLEYLILFGAISMIIGLWVLGHKVIKTIGTKIVQVTPPSGFAMELGTAFTVLTASKAGIPVSTTHCAVGAVVAVGWIKSHKGGVSWKSFRNIAIAWIVTLPVAGAVSAFVAYLCQRFVVDA